MNIRKLILPLFVGFGGLAVGFIISDHADVTGQTQLDTTDSSDRFSRLAILRQQDGHIEQAELLEQIALGKMSNDPARIPNNWQILQSNISEHSQDAFADLSRLEAFDRSVRASLLRCASLAEFDVGWRVHLSIAYLLHLKRAELQGEVAAKLENLKSQCNETMFAQSVESFLSTMESASDGQVPLEARLVAALPRPVAGASSDTVRSKLAELFRLLLKQAKSDYDSINKDVLEQHGRDKANEELAPATQSSQGAYQRLFERLARLQDSLEAADLDRWLLFTNDQQLSASVDPLRQSISQLAQRAFELQRSRYNLWALMQIHTAEESGDWPQRLGQVDIHLLHPTVSALYSMVYNRRIKESAEEDRHKRGNFVRLLLNQNKVRLGQF